MFFKWKIFIALLRFIYLEFKNIEQERIKSNFIIWLFLISLIIYYLLYF